MRGRGGNTFLLCLLGALLLLAPPGARGEEARVRGIDPEVGDGRLQGRLRTSGLPTEKQLQSMRSGLEAAVELHLALQDDGDEVLARRQIVLRMGFDLWDQVYSVRMSGRERRFNGLPELQSYLAEVRGLDLCSTGMLRAEERYRLQVAMVVHAVAPEEQDRVEKVITGESPDPGQGQDQQEASVSLGRLIRIFYKGGQGSDGDQRLLSDWFGGREVRP